MMDSPALPSGAEERRERPRGLRFLLARFVDPKIGEEWQFLSPNPYPGLRSFAPDEKPLFKGRDDQVDDLRGLLAGRNVILVQGGSGSGKSSVVRAGLLANLAGFGGIPGRTGRWYTAEFAPGTNPAQALVKGLAEMLTDRFAGQGEKKAEARRELARLLNLSEPLSLAELQRELGKHLTIQREGTREPVIWVDAVQDFTATLLGKIDDALYDISNGPPTLLLLIDQFEEVFRLPSYVQAQALVDLVVRTYTPKSRSALHLALTLRSEELHRCTEFRGLTEVVNKSAYLLDRMDRNALRNAIVEPARAVLSQYRVEGWDQEDDIAPYDEAVLSHLLEGTVGLLQPVQAAGGFASEQERGGYSADAIPLLQHALRRLWQAASERWQVEMEKEPIDATTLPRARLLILKEDMEKARIFGPPGESLRNCLNAWANLTLSQAVQDLGRIVPAPRDMLAMTFDALSGKDDNGKWIRKFCTIDTIAAVSEIAMHKNLVTAFTRFRDAGYLQERQGFLNVSHEALFRSWTTFLRWMNQCDEVTVAIADADAAIDQAREEKRWPSDPPTGWWGKAREWGWGRQAAQANATLRITSVRALDALFGEHPAMQPSQPAAPVAGWFERFRNWGRNYGPNVSVPGPIPVIDRQGAGKRHAAGEKTDPIHLTEPWAIDRLLRMRGVVQAPSGTGAIDLDRLSARDRLNDMRRGWMLAKAWYEFGRRRGKYLVGGGVVAVVAVAVAAVSVPIYLSWKAETETARHMLAVQAVATGLLGDTRSDVPLAAWELSAILDGAAEAERSKRITAAQPEVQQMWRAIDFGARRALGEYSRIAFEQPSSLKLERAPCGNSRSHDQFATLPDGTEVQLKLEAPSSLESSTVWSFVKRGNDHVSIKSATFLAPQNAVSCLAPDASMILTWFPEPPAPSINTDAGWASRSPSLPQVYVVSWRCSAVEDRVCTRWESLYVGLMPALGLPLLGDLPKLTKNMYNVHQRLEHDQSPSINFFDSKLGNRGFFIAPENIIMDYVAGFSQPQTASPPSSVSMTSLGCPDQTSECDARSINIDGHEFLLHVIKDTDGAGSLEAGVSLAFKSSADGKPLRIANLALFGFNVQKFGTDGRSLWLSDAYGQGRRITVGRQMMLEIAKSLEKAPDPNLIKVVSHRCAENPCMEWLNSIAKGVGR